MENEKIEIIEASGEVLRRQKEDIKMVWILHFAWNIFSGWTLWIILVIGFLLMKSDISQESKKVCYNIINFNISYILYIIISAILLLTLVWFVLLPIVILIWFIVFIIWFIKHIAWDNYEYPLSIKFLK